MPQRHIEEIDFQRAILIALVILVHIVNFGNIHPCIKSGILSFLMPTFLMVTGYLLNVNKPVRRFALYLLRILMPYVIMVTGYMVLSLYFPVRDGIQHLDWNTAATILLVRAIGPYWFFRVMLICAFLCYATFRCLPRASAITKLIVYGIVLLCLSRFTPLLEWTHAFYFFLGVVIRVTSADYNRLFAASYMSVIPLSIILLFDPNLDWGNLLVIVLAFCFLSFSSAIKSLCHGKVLSTLLYIGRNTLPIYMFHPIFTMAGKFLVPAFSFDTTGVLHAIVVVVIGLAGSIMLAKVLDMTRLSWVFGKAKLLR